MGWGIFGFPGKSGFWETRGQGDLDPLGSSYPQVSSGPELSCVLRTLVADFGRGLGKRIGEGIGRRFGRNLGDLAAAGISGNVREWGE